MITMKNEQFPMIKFAVEAREDREKTIEVGRLQHKDVDVVYIRQIGEKDEIVRDAEPWLAQLEAQTRASYGDSPRTSQAWYEFAKNAFEKHKKGHSIVHEGFMVSEWPILKPGQVKNLHAMDTYTVEQIANWTESAIAMYGMGARELREKAKLWLDSADSKAEKIQALSIENKELKESLNKLLDEVKQLRDEVREDKPKRGRPAMAHAES